MTDRRAPARKPLRPASRLLTPLSGAAVICLVILGSVYAISRSRARGTAAAAKSEESAACDTGIASADAARHAHSHEAAVDAGSDASAGTTAPLLVNNSESPTPAPKGMVWI